LRGVVVVIGTNKTTPTMVAAEASSTSTIVRSVTEDYSKTPS
jgi:hypothetical protein